MILLGDEAGAAQEGLVLEGAPRMGLFLVVAGLFLLRVGIRVADRIAARPAPCSAGWGLSHVLLAVVVGFGGTLIASAIPGEGVLLNMCRMQLILGTVAFASVALARGRGDDGRRALGVAGGGNARGVVAGLALYVLATPFLFGVLLVWPLLARLVGIAVEPQEILVGILDLHGVSLVFAFVLAAIVQPGLEELIFRGFVQPALVRLLRPGGGILITSVLFASLHGSSALLPILVLSVLLGWLQLRTGRLAVVWAVHGLHNAVFLALGFALAPD